jgi:hypothetical protein
MPILWWIAAWSCLLGSATFMCDAPSTPGPTNNENR